LVSQEEFEMATAAAQQLDQQISDLERQANSARAKLQEDTRKLNEAAAERQRIVEGIAHGTVKESEAPRVKAEIERLEVRIEGHRSILGPIDAKLAELHKENGRQQEEAAREARGKAYAELRQKGAAARQRVADALERLVTVDVVALDEVRTQLRREFADMGGEREALILAEGFSYPDGTLVMTSKLVNAGWRLIGDLQLSVVNLWPPAQRK
jgi:chromosome segregation ATPase